MLEDTACRSTSACSGFQAFSQGPSRDGALAQILCLATNLESLSFDKEAHAHYRPSLGYQWIAKDEAFAVPFSKLKNRHACAAIPKSYLPALEVLKTGCVDNNG